MGMEKQLTHDTWRCLSKRQIASNFVAFEEREYNSINTLKLSIIRFIIIYLVWDVATKSKAHLQEIVRYSFKLKLDLDVIPSLSN
jgi:hypothetical protein